MSKERPINYLIATGVDKKSGMVNYEEMAKELPKTYPGIPTEIFDLIKKDLNGLPENDETLKFQKGEYLELAINSNDRVRYQILEAKRGHYLIGKVDFTPGVIKGEFFASNDPKTGENPDLMVCTQKELEGWFKG